MEFILPSVNWKRLGQVGHLQHQPMLTAVDSLTNSQSVQADLSSRSFPAREDIARSNGWTWQDGQLVRLCGCVRFLGLRSY